MLSHCTSLWFLQDLFLRAWPSSTWQNVLPWWSSAHPGDERNLIRTLVPASLHAKLKASMGMTPEQLSAFLAHRRPAITTAVHTCPQWLQDHPPPSLPTVLRNQSLYDTKLHLQHIFRSRAPKTARTTGVHTTATHTTESEKEVTAQLQVTASQTSVIPAAHSTTTTSTTPPHTTFTAFQIKASTQTFLSTTQKANKEGTGLTAHA